LKVTVCGAAGGIGQPLSLLLKTQLPPGSTLALYDVVNVVGVAEDIAHISTHVKVEAHLGDMKNPHNEAVDKALSGADVVIIPAGVPRKPGMTRDDLFRVNAVIVKGLAEGIAQHCPQAFVLVISNPVNSTVPIVAEVLKKKGVYDPKRVFGVTTLDIVRASTFVAEALDNLSLATSTTVPVVGGHSGVTIVPLLSQTVPPLPSTIDRETIEALTKRIQFGGDEVVKAKDGTGSATLSMAQAGYVFANHILEAAFKGKKDVIVPTYVDLTADKEGGDALKKELGADLAYFSTRVTLGPDGAEKIHPLGAISEYEKGLIQAAIPELQTNISNAGFHVNMPGYLD